MLHFPVVRRPGQSRRGDEERRAGFRAVSPRRGRRALRADAALFSRLGQAAPAAYPAAVGNPSYDNQPRSMDRAVRGGRGRWLYLLLRFGEGSRGGDPDDQSGGEVRQRFAAALGAAGTARILLE